MINSEEKEIINKELIINATEEEIEIALLENKKLVEIHKEKSTMDFSVGDIFLGKVKKIMPGLNAAFIDLGYEKDAFLHYTDLSPYIKSVLKFTALAQTDKSENGFDFTKFQVEPEIIKSGKIAEVLNGKPHILTQILKEPIAAKGPRLSCELSIPGRFVVITPFNDVVAVSKKIHSADERKRLQKIIEALKPKNIGVIIRTAAEGKQTAELHEDLTNLLDSWKEVQLKLKNAKAPLKVLSEKNKATSLLRDLLNKDFNRVIVNDKTLYNECSEYIQRIAPNKLNIVSYYQGGNIFETFGVFKQIKSSFGKTITLGSGAYLIIEHTEALHVIDVNSGYKNLNSSQEENALATNMEAAAEIARQLRLRDIGGIIVIDFIDMKNPENKKKIQDAMEIFMKDDRARHSILPISKFGIMQITRQRMRAEMKISTSELCPSCGGTGKITSSLVLVEDIESKIKYLSANNYKVLHLQVHPIVYSHLTKGWFFNSIKSKWTRRFNTKIIISANSHLGITDYTFFDSNKDLIKI